MSESPHYGVDDQLELPGGHGEKRAKAGVRDGPQQVEELQSVLWVVLQARRCSLETINHVSRSDSCKPGKQVEDTACKS